MGGKTYIKCLPTYFGPARYTTNVYTECVVIRHKLLKDFQPFFKTYYCSTTYVLYYTSTCISDFCIDNNNILILQIKMKTFPAILCLCDYTVLFTFCNNFEVILRVHLYPVTYSVSFHKDMPFDQGNNICHIHVLLYRH